MSLAKIGVCYYPEHWPAKTWATQAATMAEGGIEQVRIAEFAWSRIEPEPNRFSWEWLDEAIDTLANAGLGIIMCTPTACPPRWLIDRYPNTLPVDHNGRIRRFGSRRHYRFACEDYLREAKRISRAVIDRYGNHPSVEGWQLDNEYGCHDTTLSYAEADQRAFQRWLAEHYGTIDRLNTAWGTVFWSQEYRRFEDVGLPNLTATEANPAHRFAYWRFASDQVVHFNRCQVELLRASAGADRWITHNFMGNFTDFDHFAVAEDLDVATWDSYPLGFLEQSWFSEEEKLRYRRIGHPDWAAFHHDLYRAVGHGRFGVMEQQPGPVNWAPANAAPLGNAPAFWAMEAIAHGAELVSYFRFQQMPRAQEQLHAGLRLPDGSAAPAWDSLKRIRRELNTLPDAEPHQASVALLFDYRACWATRLQPHGPASDHLEWAFHFYRAARQRGWDIDIVGPDDSLEAYRVLMIPGTVFVSDALVQRVQAAGVRCLIGPRSGSRDDDFALPEALPPGALQQILPLRVAAVDSLRPGANYSFSGEGKTAQVTRWYESLDTDLSPRLFDGQGNGLWYVHGAHHYLNGFVDVDILGQALEEMLGDEGPEPVTLPEGVRQRRRGKLVFVFNSSPENRCFKPQNAVPLVGSETLASGDYAVWIRHEEPLVTK